MSLVERNVSAELAHNQATKLGMADVVDYLADVLGRRLVAYIGGVSNTRTVARWASGENTVRGDEAIANLREAYEAAYLITRRDSPEVAKAWFVGLNPQLGDLSPAEALREGSRKEVKSAVRAFIAGG
ncbi:hypothetical protein [Rubrobacter aplysinae]|uniref:hypothetical protein n=1 Tax=Rubrobacter aplysinae TaxID=909625 RepID=UPI000A0288F5|nr:hypothetical protein [Rubrobacter aplysinae]